MAELRYLPDSEATIRAGHYDSAVAAFDEIEAASGIRPIVHSAAQEPDNISGGSRTEEESKRAGSGTSSDHYQDNDLGRSALDINNWAAIQDAIGADRYYAIFAGHGWYNIQINGAPFPREPWHLANHDPESGSGGGLGTVAAQQTRLNVWAPADGEALITVDGIFGPESKGRTKSFQRKHGLDDDGIIGPLTTAELAKNPGAGLEVDGVEGPLTIAAEQRALGVPDDGLRGPVTISAEQTKIGATVDGQDGPDTATHLQQYLGDVAVDGERGPETIRSLQNRLNAGTF